MCTLLFLGISIIVPENALCQGQLLNPEPVTVFHRLTCRVPAPEASPLGQSKLQLDGGAPCDPEPDEPEG